MHYYDSKSKPCHEIKMANGEWRDTTLRDARKLNLFPSVTTIMDIQAKPGLLSWMQDQLLNACLKNKYNYNICRTDEEEEYFTVAWKKVVINMSKEITRKSSDKGHEIHHALEKYYKTGKILKKYTVYVEKVRDFLKSLEHPAFNYRYYSEKTFVHKVGFGGCCDLYVQELMGDKVTATYIIDFKTKEKEDIKSVKPYDDYKMQLAAYRVGLKLPKNTRCYNLFISTAKGYEGECNLVEITDLDKYWKMFYNLLRFWKIKNDYRPKL